MKMQCLVKECATELQKYCGKAINMDSKSWCHLRKSREHLGRGPVAAIVRSNTNGQERFRTTDQRAFFKHQKQNFSHSWTRLNKAGIFCHVNPAGLTTSRDEYLVCCSPFGFWDKDGDLFHGSTVICQQQNQPVSTTKNEQECVTKLSVEGNNVDLFPHPQNVFGQ